jgi:hypothetical protein
MPLRLRLPEHVSAAGSSDLGHVLITGDDPYPF